jgi:ABC transporter substrate binding protein
VIAGRTNGNLGAAFRGAAEICDPPRRPASIQDRESWPPLSRDGSASTTIPIVALDLESDPITSGLIKSFSRPGGQVTGVFFDFPEFGKKWLELLKEVMPRLAKVAVLWDPTIGAVQMKAIEGAGKLLSVELEILEVRSTANLDGAGKADYRQSSTGRRALAVRDSVAGMVNGNERGAGWPSVASRLTPPGCSPRATFLAVEAVCSCPSQRAPEQKRPRPEKGEDSKRPGWSGCCAAGRCWR